jgi:hypothetical protein
VTFSKGIQPTDGTLAMRQIGSVILSLDESNTPDGLLWIKLSER